MRKYNNQENEMIRVNEVPQDIVEGLYEGKVPFRLVCLDVSNLNEESMKLLINKHGHDVDWDLTREVFDMTDSVMFENKNIPPIGVMIDLGELYKIRNLLVSMIFDCDVSQKEWDEFRGSIKTINQIINQSSINEIGGKTND